MNEKSNYFFGIKKSTNVSGKPSLEDSDFDSGSQINDFDEKMDQNSYLGMQKSQRAQN